jgi:hypothetical protein
VIPAPLLPLRLLLQGRAGRGLVIEPLGLDLAARADASPLPHQEETAEQVRRDVEPVKPAHVLRGVDAAKVNGSH